jgi:phage regulator Rha-like protein
MSRYVKACSRTVGDDFRRRHDIDLRDIRELIEKVERSEERVGNISQSKFGQPNFIKSTYISSKDKGYPEYGKNSNKVNN